MTDPTENNHNTETTGSEAIEPATGEALDPETVFYKKLDAELATLLADYPPIEEEFIPDVKLFLKNTPKAERKEALVKFKENLVKQRIALAYCRTFIEENIELNNDISKEGLMVLVKEFNENYRFTQKQQEVLEKAIDRYIENRKNCLEIRNRYEDTPEGNTALIKELTGKDISEEEMKEVELSVGPMTINIRTTEDIAKKLAKKPKEQSFRGFSNYSSDKSVRYVIINRDMHDDTKVYSQEDTLQHEYEHLKYKIFKDIFESEINEEEVKNLKENYEQKTGPEQEIALRAYLGIEQEKVLQRVQEEITASMNDKSLNEIQEKIMPLFFKEDGEYDYLKPIRDSAFCKNLNQAEQKIYQEIIIDESKYIIARAISALITLQEEGKYSPKKIIGLLTDKPLRDWPKTADRLLEQIRTQKEADQEKELTAAFQGELQEQKDREGAYEAAYHAYGDTLDTPEKEHKEGASQASQEKEITAVIDEVLHNEQELTDEEKEEIWDSANVNEMSQERLAEILEEIKANSTEQKIKDKINEVLTWIQEKGPDIAKRGGEKLRRGAELGSRYVGKPALGASKFLGGGALLGMSGIFAGIAGVGYGIYKGAEGAIDFLGGFLGKIGKLIWQGRIYMGEGESKEGDLFDLYQDFRHRLRWRHRLWGRKEDEHKKSGKS